MAANSSPSASTARAPQAPVRAGRRTPRWPFAVAVLFWLAVASAVALAGYTGYARYTSSRIMPGVRALGLDLGGLTREQAAALIQNEVMGRQIVLDGGFATWSLPPDSLGIQVDAEAIAAEAARQWRSLRGSDELFATGKQILAGFLQDYPEFQALASRIDPRLIEVTYVDLPITWHFVRDAATETLRVMAGQTRIDPRDATVRISADKVEAVAPITGRALDMGTALASLEAHAEELALQPRSADGVSPLPVTLSLPVISLLPAVTDVSEVVEETRQLLRAPVSVRLWDPITDEHFDLEFPPEILSGWLAFAQEPGDPVRLGWYVDETKVVAALEAAEATFLGAGRYVEREKAVPALVEAFTTGAPAPQLRVYHADRTHTVNSGETLSSIAYDYGIPYPWIMAANTDLGDSLLVGQKIRIPSVDALLPLEPSETKRIQVSLSDQRMWAYENGKLKWEWPISTGMKSSPTSPGIFQVQSHDELAYAANWNLWMPYFMGIYRPVPGQEFMNGFHGFPSRDRKQFLWERNLGGPITYGCILVSTENAKKLYEWADEGVIVEIEK